MKTKLHMSSRPTVSVKKRHGQRRALSSFSVLPLSLAISLASSMATAQDSEDVEKKQYNASDFFIEEVIITGTAGGSKMRRLDASFAISTMNEEEIKRFAPSTAGDLLNSVPGIFTETGFGNAGVSTRVRGLSVGDGNLTSIALNGAPVFPVNAIEGIEHAGLIRYDETIRRVESVVAGTSSIFGQGQPGLTSNYVLKEGAEESEGILKYTTSDYDLQRFDAMLSGKIADGLYYMIGGYVESSSDFRDAEFNSGEGQQYTINITKELDNGRISIYTRDLDDSSAYSLFQPVSQSLGELPGFNPSQDTLLSDSLRFQDILLNNSGDVKRYDLKDGRVTDVNLTGLSAEFELPDEWTLRNNLNFTSGGTNNAFLVPLWARPVSSEGTLGDLPDGRAGVGGTATEISTGRALGADELVYQSRYWIQDTEIESFSNDISFSKSIGDHSVTFGLYVASYDLSYFQNRGTNIYHTAEKNAQRIELVQANGDRTYNGQSQYVGWGPVSTATNEGETKAFYISDTWAVTDRLLVDGSIRHESMKQRSSSDSCNFDACDLVALPNGVEVRINDGVVDAVHEYDDSETSWSLGGNFSLSNNSSVFARIGEGHLMPQPQNVVASPLNEASSLEQVEIGYKLATDSFDLFATMYALEFSSPSISSEEGVIVRRTSATEVKGIELDAAWRWGNLEVNVVAGLIKSEFTESTDSSIIGNEPARTPDFTFRASPSYLFELGDDTELVVFGAVQAFGERWGNNQNTGSKIPSYETFDLGANLKLGDVEVQLVAKNLTDEIGLTEGTPQTTDAITPFAVLVPGRTVKLSVGYEF